jgi:hypothetical protein
MTPEDVKAQLSNCQHEDILYPKDIYSMDVMCVNYFQRLELKSIRRILKWEFNTFHDGANYTVGDYRFWFQLKEGIVKAGYAHKIRGSGLSGGIECKHCYGRDPFKGITTLQQIDTLFGMMSIEYR